MRALTILALAGLAGCAAPAGPNDAVGSLKAGDRVPTVRDVPLARALYRSCDIDDEIPAALFDAVARLLAFVFTLRRSGPAALDPAMLRTLVSA